MGVAVSNIGGGRDFATGDHYIELHRRLIVPPEQHAQIIQLLEDGEYDAAASALKAVTPPNTHDVIDVYFCGLKAQKGFVKDSGA